MLDVLNMDSIEVRRPQVSIDASNSIETKPLNLLLIEADSIQQSQRRWLLTDPTYRVTAVFGIREFFLLRAKVIDLALLSDSLGQSALRDVAQSVRKQWPMARILVLGSAWPALDDNLYDDEISQTSKQEGLRDMIAKLTPTFPSRGIHTGVDRRDDLGTPERFDVYYGMADSRIGVARFDMPDRLPPGADADPPESNA